MFFFPSRIPIPPAFYSADTDAPMATCLTCDRPLLDTGAEYLVEKAIRQHAEYDVRETIIEYAMCLNCHAGMQERISAASRQALEAYFLNHADLYRRATLLLSASTTHDPSPDEDPDEDFGEDFGEDSGEEPAAPPEVPSAGASPDLDRWLDHCIIHGTPVEELSEFQLIGHCQGREMLVTHMPFVIGGEAMDEILQLLSNETLDELGGFRDEHFGPPPALKRDLPGPIFV